MSKYINKEEDVPSLNSADIAVIILALQNCEMKLGPYPFTQVTQLSKTINKLIKLKEHINNV